MVQHRNTDLEPSAGGGYQILESYEAPQNLKAQSLPLHYSVPSESGYYHG